MGILWDSLLELDELSASTNSVMELLSILVVVLSDETVASEAQSLIGSLNILVTRLWPFLSHNISSVRQSCVKTLLSLLTSEVKTTEKCMYNLIEQSCLVILIVLLESFMLYLCHHYSYH